MTIQFLGAAQEVTGSKHLITTQTGKRILLDCGMYQGKGMETDAANRDLGFDPAGIDYIILSHAHIDHSGLIPYLYRQGFRGEVISTPATRDLCALMLLDTSSLKELSDSDEHSAPKLDLEEGEKIVGLLYEKTTGKLCITTERPGKDANSDPELQIYFCIFKDGKVEGDQPTKVD